MERATLQAPRRFFPSRAKGQCFLKDSQVAARIVREIAPSPDETLIEIGGGTGELTIPLLRSGAGKLVIIESDPRLAAELRRKLSDAERSRFELVEEDALKADFEALRGSRELERVRVCGNLPYSVASPILLRLLAVEWCFRDFNLMFQDEVAARLVARPATKAYGFLSVMAQQAAAVRIAFRIPPEAFRPRPRVVSALVSFELRHDKAPDVGDPATFRSLVRGLLAHRRKTLANNIKRLGHGKGSKISPAVVREALAELSIDPQRRGEALTVEEFAELSRLCCSYGPPAREKSGQVGFSSP